MKNLVDFALQEKYQRVKELRPRLEEMRRLIDWDALLPLFPQRETTRGRPEYEKKIMLKILFLQSCYGISDEEMEFQIYDRLSFQQFLGFPDSIPDFTTIWRFREELTEGDIIERIWDALQLQITQQGIVIKKGAIQDATFIHADPGKKRSSMRGRGREANTSRSKDGTWTKKGSKSIFGFKAHHKTDAATKIVTEVAVSTAKTFDGKIDLANDDEIIYRDRCYSGSGTRAKGDGSMKRGKLTPHEKLRNARISKKRCRGEHPFGTMCRSFKAGRTRLTELARVFVQHIFVCAAYNIHRLRYILKSSASSH
jgi:transposase, IS5 family